MSASKLTQTGHYFSNYIKISTQLVQQLTTICTKMGIIVGYAKWRKLS